MKRYIITMNETLTAARNNAADIIFDAMRNAAHNITVDDISAAAADIDVMLTAERAATVVTDNAAHKDIVTMFAMNNAAAADLFNDNAAAARNDYNVTANNAAAYIADVRSANAAAAADRVAAADNSKSVPVVDADNVFDIAVIIAVNTARNMYRNFGGTYAAELYNAVIRNAADGQDLISVGYTAVLTAYNACGVSAIAIRVGYKAVNSYIEYERNAARYDVSRISNAEYMRVMEGNIAEREPAAETPAARIAAATLARIAEKVELSERQKHIIAMIAGGTSYEDIARHFNCSKSTVCRNIKSVRDKCISAGIVYTLEPDVYAAAIERLENAERNLASVYAAEKCTDRVHKTLFDVRAEYDRRQNAAAELTEQANKTPAVTVYKFDSSAADIAAAADMATPAAIADNIAAAEREYLAANSALRSMRNADYTARRAELLTAARPAMERAAARRNARRADVVSGNAARRRDNAIVGKRVKAIKAGNAAAARYAVSNAAERAARRAADIAAVAADVVDYDRIDMLTAATPARIYDETAIAAAAAERAEHTARNAELNAIAERAAAADRVIKSDVFRKLTAERQAEYMALATPAAERQAAATPAARRDACMHPAYVARRDADNAARNAETPAAIAETLTAAIAAENAARNAARRRNTKRNAETLTAAIAARRAAANALYTAANALYTDCGNAERRAAADLIKFALNNI